MRQFRALRIHQYPWRIGKPLITFLLFLGCLLVTTDLLAADQPAAKPLFRDPIHDGAADPSVIWNPIEKKWFMFYTNRRANMTNLPGVSWVHGTRIGTAESSDQGTTWKYRGVADIALGEGDFSHWAPEVVEHNGRFHMFLSFVPGMHTDWSGTRDIVHLTSTNLLQWKKESTLNLSSDRVIDACVFRLPDGTWRMWYNNEPDKKAIYYADSTDLYRWTDRGRSIGDRPGEGPKVFRWHDRYWMVVDNWQGLGVYSSTNALNWQRQERNLLDIPGEGVDDQVKGGHPDVVVSGDRAFVFYFTHPGRRGAGERRDAYDQRRSSIQVVELEYKDGMLTCDRDKPCHVKLMPPAQASAATRSVSYLFSYFVGNGEDGLHLAWSEDGYRWETLNQGRSYLQPRVGESKLMRDPCLLRGPDGRFHMVWTTSWGGQTIGYAHSKDLIEWSEQKAIPVMGHEPAVLNSWAPEIAWDDARREYLIFWASTVTNRFTETAGTSEDKYNHRMYATATRDFETFTPTRLFFDPGFSVIDATLLPAKGRYYLVFKDETVRPPKKHLRLTIADAAGGPFTNMSAPFTRDWVEGPTCLKVGDDYVVYYDCYRDHHYGAVRSRDLVNWEDVTKQLSMPKGLRHGTAIAVEPEIVERLRNAGSR